MGRQLHQSSKILTECHFCNKKQDVRELEQECDLVVVLVWINITFDHWQNCVVYIR